MANDDSPRIQVMQFRDPATGKVGLVRPDKMNEAHRRGLVPVGPTWYTPKKKAAPPEPSTLGELGRGLLDPIKALPEFAAPGGMLATYPEQQFKDADDYRRRAQEALKAGDLMGFLGHSINAALAVTTVPQTVESLSNMPPARAAGNLTSMFALGEAAPEELQNAARTPLRAGLGIGETGVDIARKAFDKELSKAQLDYQADLAKVRESNQLSGVQARGAYEGELADLERQNAEGRAKTEAAAEKVRAANEKALENYKSKVQQARDNYAAKVRESAEARKVVSARESAAKAKSRVSGPLKSGPLYQQLTSRVDELAANAIATRDAVKANLDAGWAKLRDTIEKNAQETTGAPAVTKWTPVKQAVLDAERTYLGGVPENVKLFRQILAEGGEDFLDTAEGAKPAAAAPVDIPYSKAQAYYTKLGNKIWGRGELPRTVSAALKQVRTAVGDALGENAGAAGLRGFHDKLKADYSAFMESFFDRGAPMRDFLEGSQDERLGQLAKDNAGAISATLGRYSALGGDPSLAGRARALQQAVSNLPGSAGKMPELPSRGEAVATIPREPPEPKPKPEFTPKPEPPAGAIDYKQDPELPALYPFDPEGFRRERLQNLAGTLTTPTRFDFSFMGSPTLPGRRGLGWLLNIPGVENWLTKGP